MNTIETRPGFNVLGSHGQDSFADLAHDAVVRWPTSAVAPYYPPAASVKNSRTQVSRLPTGLPIVNSSQT
jgi:hypothetical protein